MTLEGPSTKEVEEAVKFLEDLRKDPIRFEKWADKVIKGWIKGKRKSSERHFRHSKAY